MSHSQLRFRWLVLGGATALVDGRPAREHWQKGGRADCARRHEPSREQWASPKLGGGSAECCNGRLMIFEPSNTAIVKNFVSDGCMHTGSNEAENDIVGGFINTTSAIDEINFAFSAGNITSGSISMYGVK